MGQVNVGVGGVWKPAKPYVGVGGVWKEVKAGFVGVSGSWKQVYAVFTPPTLPPLTGSVSGGTWSGGFGTWSASTSASASGGSGSYSYAWGDGSGAQPSDPAAASTSWLYIGDPVPTDFVQCFITDLVTGETIGPSGVINP